MKIKKLDLLNLRNEEIAQFFTEFKDLVLLHDATTLNIEALFATFLVNYKQIGEALNLIIKSTITAKLVAADEVRDDAYRGFKYIVKGNTYYFDADKKEAAIKIQNVLDRYNGMERKAYEQETASYNALLAEFKNDLSTEIKLLGLNDWIKQMQTTNEAFNALMSSRFDEGASQTDLRMKEIRIEIGNVYQSITNRIEASILLNGEAAYTDFVKKLNQRIEYHTNVIATRRGRNEL